MCKMCLVSAAIASSRKVPISPLVFSTKDKHLGGYFSYLKQMNVQARTYTYLRQQ